MHCEQPFGVVVAHHNEGVPESGNFVQIIEFSRHRGNETVGMLQFRFQVARRLIELGATVFWDLVDSSIKILQGRFTNVAESTRCYAASHRP